MPKSDDVIAVVRAWVERAESDLITAANSLKIRRPPKDTICFHAQQCIEKYVKALLTAQGIDFPRTHRLRELLCFLPSVYRPNLSPEEQERLTDYATVTRYPGDYEPLALAETKQAVAIARRVRREVRKILPTSALRRKED